MTNFLRRVFAPGFAVVALLAGTLVAVPEATASDNALPPPQPRTMNELVRMPANDLTSLYLASPASVPQGFAPGRAIKNPGTRAPR